jgi:hypothetical protein
VEENVASKPLFTITSNSAFEFLPIQEVSFKISRINFEELRSVVINSNYGLLPTQIGYVCDYMTKVNLLLFFPLSLGHSSEHGTFYFSSPEIGNSKKQNITSILSGNRTKGGNFDLSFLSNIRFKQNSIEYISFVPSVTQFLPESIVEFILHIPFLCQNIQFHANSFTSGWRICVNQQTINLVDDSSSLNFTFSGLNTDQQTLPSLLSPLGNSIREISRGRNLTIMTSMSRSNILSYFCGMQNSSSFSFSAHRTIGNSTRRTLTTSTSWVNSCFRIENSFFGFPLTFQVCTVGNRTTLVLNAMERNSVITHSCKTPRINTFSMS